MNKINILFTICLLCFFSVQLSAQQLTFRLNPTTITAAVGDEIDVEVSVGDGFTDLIGMQFGMNYNGAALEYLSFDNTGNPLSPNYSVVKIPNKSEIINQWADIFNPSPVTLTPGTVLYTMKFRVLSDIGNSIEILCGGDNFLCEFTNSSLSRSNDVSVETVLDINGGGPSENAGPINVTLSNETVASGGQACVQFEVANFVDIVGVQFSLQYDETLLSYSGPLQNSSDAGCPDNPPASNPLCLGPSNLNLVEPGTLTFSFADIINANAFTVNDGTVILDLCFDAIGAGGTSSDIIINGDPLFVQVTKQGEGAENFGLNSNTGSITISGSGGALDVVTYSIGMASGDNGTNVCVPVTVDDGFDDILGFGWSVDYDPAILSYTGIQNINSSLGNVSGNEPNAGKLSFLWSAPFTPNSEVTLADGSVLYEMCFDVIGGAGEISDLAFSNSPNPIETVKVDGPDPDTEQDLTVVNTNDGNVTVSNTEGFNLLVCEGDACPGDQICVPVLGTGITEIAAMSFTFEYDTDVLDFTSHMSNLQMGVNEPANNPGFINVLYVNLDQPPAPGTLTLPNCEEIITFCFDVVGNTGASSSLDITSSQVDYQASTVGDNGLPEEVEVASTSGAVNVNCSGTAGQPIVTCTCGAAELMIDEDATIVDNVSCNAEQDGAITLSVSGGEMPLTFSWSNGADTQDLSDLGPGTYTVNVSDADGAMVSATFMVTEPTAISPNSTASNLSAENANDGSISLNVSGGTSPYTYLWSSGQTTATISNLSPATYNVTITDDNGCTLVTSRTVGENLTIGESGGPGSPAGTTILTDVVCFGENTGAIDLALLGGVAPFSINWDFGSNQANVAGLAAGNYCVTITDTNGDQANGCFDISGPNSAIDISGVITPQSIPGANDGNIDLNVTGGQMPYTYNWNGPNVNNDSSEDLSNLTEGNYTVNVSDALGCFRSFTFFVETAGEALAINSGATQVANISCFGETDGAINPSVTGGATPYSYAWSGPNSFTGNTANISGLEPGTYVLTVTDAVGTMVVSVPFLVSQPSAPLSASAQITDESAPGQNDGGIQLTVSGGTPGYSFIWSNNNFSADNFGLTMGTYTVTITDIRGCTLIETYTVNSAADPIVIDALASTVNNVRCFGDQNGSISPVVNGGVPPYNYNWGAEGTDRDISGLAAGQYTLTVTDQIGLMAVQTFLVNTPPQLNVSVGPTIPESSNGDDGSIQVSVSGGTPNYTYSWTGPNGFFSTSQDISGLSEGSYTLTVIDANGCQEQIVVPLGAVLSIQNKFEIDVDCFGECTGEIDLVVQGGQAPYLYNWAGPDNFSATTQDIDELCAGVYTATITDAAGQQVFSTCRIDEPLLALSIGDNPTIIDEIVPNDGSINITVNGGTPPYSYQWSNQETSEDLTELQAGSYRVTVTDANGCIVISPDYEIERIPLPIRIENVVLNSPTCNGDCDGSVSMQIVGGDAPYTLTWNDLASQTLSTPNPNYTRDDMCAGDYVLTVTDANGQEEFLVVLLEDLPAIMITGVVTPETTGNDGTINTTVTGGEAPYSYEWAPSTLPQTPDQENLSAGLFIVTVTDANDCSAIQSFVVEDNVGPLVITNFEITQIECFGDENGSIDITVAGGELPYDFSWSDSQVTEDAIGLGAGTYTVTVTDAAGTTIVESYTIDAVSEIDADIVNIVDVTPGLCDGQAEINESSLSGGAGGYTYLWPSGETTASATALCEGDASVTISDANDCSVVIQFDLGVGVPLGAAVQSDDISCAGDATGSLFAEPIGGIPPYSYLWSTGETTQSIVNLLPGEYSLTITDATGAIEEQGPFPIEEPEPITVRVETTPETGMGTGDGSATVFVEGGTAPYIYQWNNPAGQGCMTASCDSLTAGLYFVVIQDAAECIKVDSAVVTNLVGGECQMTRNIITPDQDGKNDSFIIQCAPGSINTLEIYNRWGQLVFTADNYDNTWEGTNRRGQDLPPGGYFYVFLLEDPVTGETVPFQGHITILRE